MENKYTNKYVIETGIGLQDVDNLKNSSYFKTEAERYIKGEISLDDLDRIISTYYESKPLVEFRSEEADKIAVRIAKLISEDYFTFSIGQLMTIHKELFDGVFNHAGKLRRYNFSKKEWVLDGASVLYGDYRELESTLQYDFNLEMQFDYSKLDINETIEHLALFIANLWQIHAFEEGNTRTVAVFFIKYLRSLGFDVTNDTFAKNAWYFKNALVRSNYTNVIKKIFPNRKFLVMFLRNLLLGEKNELLNRELHIKNNISSDNKKVKLLSIIRTNPTIKQEELASMLGVSLRTIKSVTKELVVEGVIVRDGSKKTGSWKILK